MHCIAQGVSQLVHAEIIGEEVPKIVLFAPGFDEGLTTTRDYVSVMGAIAYEGYSVSFMPIDWKNTDPTDWDTQLQKVYERYDPKATVLAGFSLGAMTVAKLAARRTPSELWLCSLSPYYEEDDVGNHVPDSWPQILHEYYKATPQKFSELATAITCKTLLFHGTEESVRLRHRAHEAARLLPHARRISMKAGHDVADPHYIAAIQRAIAY